MSNNDNTCYAEMIEMPDFFVFQRFTLGVRLYYKVMEAMLESVQ